MWWEGLGNLFKTAEPQLPLSDAEQLRMHKKLLAKEIAEKKMDIKKLRRSIRARREERWNELFDWLILLYFMYFKILFRFKEKVAAMPARVERVNIDGLGTVHYDFH